MAVEYDEVIARLRGYEPYRRLERLRRLLTHLDLTVADMAAQFECEGGMDEELFPTRMETLALMIHSAEAVMEEFEDYLPPRETPDVGEQANNTVHPPI